MAQTLHDPPPGVMCLLAVAFLASVASRSVTAQELQQHTARLSAPSFDIELLSAACQ